MIMQSIVKRISSQCWVFWKLSSLFSFIEVVFLLNDAYRTLFYFFYLFIFQNIFQSHFKSEKLQLNVSSYCQPLETLVICTIPWEILSELLILFNRKEKGINCNPYHHSLLFGAPFLFWTLCALQNVVLQIDALHNALKLPLRENWKSKMKVHQQNKILNGLIWSLNVDPFRINVA